MDIAEEIENKIVVSLFNVLRSQAILNLNKSHKQERVPKTAPFPQPVEKVQLRLGFFAPIW